MGDKPYFAWDYITDSQKRQYSHIYPCSPAGEFLCEDGLKLRILKGEEMDNCADTCVAMLNTIAAEMVQQHLWAPPERIGT
jgi:hypothetical protein